MVARFGGRPWSGRITPGPYGPACAKRGQDRAPPAGGLSRGQCGRPATDTGLPFG